MASRITNPAEASLTPAGRPLRQVAMWALAATSVVFAVLLVPIPFKGRVAVAIGDCCHAPLFAAITIGTHFALESIWPIKRNMTKLLVRCGFVLAGLATFGVLMEWLQHHLGRSASVHDAIANTLGASAATAWYIGYRSPSKIVARSLTFAAILFLLAAWIRPSVILHDVWKVRHDYPVICSFESEMQLTRWYLRGCSAKLVTEDATDGRYAGQFDFEKQLYPAATMVYFASDWRDLQSLQMDVTLDQGFPKEGVTLMIKVVDLQRATDHTDTFRMTQTLRSGERKAIRITREELRLGPNFHNLDLSDVQFLEIGLIRPEAPATIRVDNIRVVTGAHVEPLTTSQIEG